MNRRSFAVLAFLVLALFMASSTTSVHAAPTYNVTAQPSTVNEGESVIITVTITGGSPNTNYSMGITVTKPGGVGVASITLTLRTDGTGSGPAAAVYPNNIPAWTLVSGGAPNTDVSGIYSITVDKLGPNPVQSGVASGSFDVVTNLIVTITSPPASTSVSRGDTVIITACVTYVDLTPVNSATVTSNTPSSSITLSLTNPCTYSRQYQVQLGDPLGAWNMNVSASYGGNYGSKLNSVTVTPASLIVTGLSTYNSYGTPTSDFNPGDTVYARFQVQYSPGGNFLTNGNFSIQVRDPSGGTKYILQTIYDPSRQIFYTPSGFAVSSQDTAGNWQLAFAPNSISDAYQNTGPATLVTQRVVVHTNALVISEFYYIVGAVGASGGLSTIVFLRKFNTKRVPFENLFKLTGGELRAPASLLVLGDAGAGSSTLGLQLLYRDLLAGKYCGLLSYDSFPSEVKTKMRDMGWDVSGYMEKGQMTILDCYSALAGVEKAQIRDPTDFTEVSIQVTGMIEKGKSGPVTILLDSVTPIFNAASAKDCINFLQVIAAKVKNSGGMFIVTATKGSIPDEAKSKLESLADGVIELNLSRKSGSLSHSLIVKKLSGRATSSVETGFEIVSGKGIMLKKRIVPTNLFQPK